MLYFEQFYSIKQTYQSSRTWKKQQELSLLALHNAAVQGVWWKRENNMVHMSEYTHKYTHSDTHT